jgi:hypothetical protein
VITWSPLAYGNVKRGLYDVRRPDGTTDPVASARAVRRAYFGSGGVWWMSSEARAAAVARYGADAVAEVER